MKLYQLSYPPSSGRGWTRTNSLLRISEMYVSLSGANSIVLKQGPVANRDDPLPCDAEEPRLEYHLVLS